MNKTSLFTTLFFQTVGVKLNQSAKLISAFKKQDQGYMSGPSQDSTFSTFPSIELRKDTQHLHQKVDNMNCNLMSC